MRLTKAGDYALRCVLYLSGEGKGALATRKDIARAMKIPEQFLGKIAQQLSRAGIVEIIQGPRGGLRLARPPAMVTLLDVVEAVVGEIFLNDCVLYPEMCGRSCICAIHEVWEKARGQLRDTLRATTFESLVLREGCARKDLAPGPLPCAAPEEGSQRRKRA